MHKLYSYSNISIRIGLAVVFLWFGVGKFINPSYWLNAWVPHTVITLLPKFRLSGMDFIYLNGIFEILIGLSLISGLGLRFFSFLGIIFLFVVLLFNGVSEVTIRDVGLMGGLLSLLFWPIRSTNPV